jgi:hypothetical protein
MDYGSDCSIKFHGYSTRTIHHNRYYNILKVFIMQFITFDLKFNITSEALKIMETPKIKIKETRK